MKNILTLSDFDENNNLVEPNSGIVLFFAEWCGHCKKLLPTFEKIDEASKDVSVFAVNCSDSKDEDVKTLMKNFDIKGYPTIFWFVDGKNMGKYEGGRREEDILKLLTSSDDNFLSPLVTPEPEDSVFL